MPAYVNPLEPVALAREAIRREPSNEVRRVRATEQMARVGPIDYGPATALSEPTESGSNIISLNDELGMNDGTLGQFLINPLSRVEVEIRQTGDQEQRFVNKNEVGRITPTSPLSQRLVWVWEDQDISAIIRNPNDWDMAKTLVYYTGYKFVLSDPLSEQAVQDLAGEPASIPTDALRAAFGGGR